MIELLEYELSLVDVGIPKKSLRHQVSTLRYYLCRGKYTSSPDLRCRGGSPKGFSGSYNSMLQIWSHCGLCGWVLLRDWLPQLKHFPQFPCFLWTHFLVWLHRNTLLLPPSLKEDWAINWSTFYIQDGLKIWMLYNFRLSILSHYLSMNLYVFFERCTTDRIAGGWCSSYTFKF